jgi:hypothetical protein
VATNGGRTGGDERLDSIEALIRRAPSIVARLNDKPALALRAVVDPLLVLREMGIELTDRLVAEVELRLRFGPEQFGRLEQLRAEINKRAGEVFDVDDPGQVHHVLFNRLKLPPLPAPVVRVVIARSQAVAACESPLRHELEHPWTAPGHIHRLDPLERLRDAHPALGPLLEYRTLLASRRPLAPHELVARLLAARGSAKTRTQCVHS